MTTNSERIIKKMIKHYAIREDNVFFAERLFVANTVLSWVLENTKEEVQRRQYITQIEKHLTGEITLYWDKGVIKFRKDQEK
jgi:hypothetical protein